MGHRDVPGERHGCGEARVGCNLRRTPVGEQGVVDTGHGTFVVHGVVLLGQGHGGNEVR